MIDSNGFSVKRVRDIIRTGSLYKYLYRKERKLHLGQNLAI